MSWQHVAGIAGSLILFVGVLSYLSIEISVRMDDILDALTGRSRP